MLARRSPLISRSLQLAKLLAAALLLAMLIVPAATQTAPTQAPTPLPGSQPQSPNLPTAPAQPGTPTHDNSPAKTDVPGAGVTVEQKQGAEGPAQPQTESEPPQHPITKAEAKDLFRSVDQILDFASNDTGLPVRHSVKRKLITRRAVESYVDKRIKDDKDTQRLERSQAILKKFGLLPPDYDLHTEFLKLLGEQVAAYYDAKTKTVNLLDWVQPDLQKPVLAHELTHALQDQAVGLEKWGLAGAKDDRPEPDQQEQVIEEAQAARQAVTEGQAMIVLLDYSLAPLGKTVATAPEVADALRAGMGDSKDSPVFAAAPMFLRESMLMPYTFGIDFVRSVLVKQGKEAAFGGMLAHPPVDTRQIMQPETYLTGQVVEPLKVPDLDRLVGPDYERYDFGDMGEFDVYLLTKQYAPKEDARKIYEHWRGGYYFAVHPKDAPKDEIALLYLSRWDSPEAATAFAKLYFDYAPKRYPQWSKNGVSVASVGGGSEAETWAMGSGKDRVHLERKGKDLLIIEGFDRATSEQLSSALLSGGKTSPQQTASR